MSNTKYVADSAPTIDGVKYMVKVHTAPGPSDEAQGGSAALVVKSLLFVPVMAAAEKAIGTVPTFVIVTVDDTRIPTEEVPKLTDAGVNSTPVPVPERATVWGLVASLSATLKVPVGKPTAVGVNTT